MNPTIKIYKGFILFDPQNNTNLYNQLRSSTFLTLHPKGRQFFCMLNNIGLKFIRQYKDFLIKNFELSPEVKSLIESKSKLTYIEKRTKKLQVPTFPGVIWKDHQEKALELISKYKQYCIFLGPGTGKTLIALGAIKMLSNNSPQNYLVVTPKKAIPQYKDEIKKYLPGFNVITDVRKFNPTISNICVVNYESIHKFADLTSYKAMLLDESHKAKNVSSETNKILCKIKSENTFLFSGTPQDKQRDEVFAQLKILNPLLYSVKYLFNARFFTLDDYYKPIGEKHGDELEEIISKCTYGDKTENLLDLPKEVEFVMPCTLDSLRPEYKKFKDKKVLKGKGWMALGDSPAKHRTKLTQLCSGFIYDEDGKAHRTPFNPKEKGFRTLINKCPQAIIYTMYDEEQKIIKDILDSMKKNYVIVNGQSKDSAESLKKFKDGKTDYLVIQIVSGNAALDFPHINNIIYYSLHDSYIYYEQSKYRIRRIGQTKDCHYYYIIVKGTVEPYRLKSLKDKKSFNNKEFDIYKRRDIDET